MQGNFGGNNEAPIGVTAYAPMTVNVTDNEIESDGHPISIATLPGVNGGLGAEAGTTDVWVERNVLTTADPSNSSGLDIDLRPGADSVAHARVYDNVAIGLAGCFCGGSAGVNIESVSPGGTSGSAVVDVWHNTVVRTARGGSGPAAGMNIYQNSDTSLRVNLFDNIVADGRGWGIWVGGTDAPPVVASGFNDSFGNTRPDEWNAIAHPHHLSVDPRFVDAAAHDYRLRGTSPLVDAGVVCRAGGLGARDVAGMQRLAGHSVDIGAYERGAVAGDVGVVRMSGSAASFLTGTEAQDFLCGFGGLDELDGYGGNDYLDGGKGAGDFLFGWAGADVLVTKDGEPDDHADGGKGVDLCRTDPDDVRVSC
jgi:hypothetical protein